MRKSDSSVGISSASPTTNDGEDSATDSANVRLANGVGCAAMIFALCLGVGSCSFLSRWTPGACPTASATPTPDQNHPRKAAS